MGNIKISFFLTFKSIIKGNRWAPIMIIAIMSLSFANLLIIPSLVSGVTNTLDQQQVDTLLGNILVDPPTVDPPTKEHYLIHASQIEDKLNQQPGVIATSSHIVKPAVFEYDLMPADGTESTSKTGSWNVIGVNPDEESRVTTIRDSIIAGDYLDNASRDEILLGIEIAGGEQADSASFLNLGGVKVGDMVRLTYTNGSFRKYHVKGIFQARSPEADRLAFVTEKEMLSIMGLSGFADIASQILIKTSPRVSEAALITTFKTLGIDGEFRSWRDYGSISGIVSSFDVIASLIRSIGLVVAAIVMFIVIYISVVNKKRQIGILRAIGINNRVILSSYVMQSLFYAVMGIIIGGLVFGFVVLPYFNNHPIDLSIGRVTLSVSSSTVESSVMGILLASLLAGILPVLNIIRSSIIKSIWGN